MNSEITNVSKLVPVAIVKPEKQASDKNVVSKIDATAESNDVAVQKKLMEQARLQKQDDKKRAEQKGSLSLVKSAAEQGNSLLQVANRNLEFKVDEATKEVVVKIVDSETGELIRQIPAEEMLDLIKRMQEIDGGNQGVMIQDRA